MFVIVCNIEGFQLLASAVVQDLTVLQKSCQREAIPRIGNSRAQLRGRPLLPVEYMHGGGGGGGGGGSGGAL